MLTGCTGIFSSCMYIQQHMAQGTLLCTSKPKRRNPCCALQTDAVLQRSNCQSTKAANRVPGWQEHKTRCNSSLLASFFA